MEANKQKPTLRLRRGGEQPRIRERRGVSPEALRRAREKARQAQLGQASG